MEQQIKEIISNWVGENFGSQEKDDPSWNIDLLAKEIAEKLPEQKFYEAEMRAFDFMRGWHSLQEWADYGFNKVVFEDKSYWDGLLNGDEDIYEDVENLEYDYYENDEDGYMTVYLRKGEK